MALLAVPKERMKTALIYGAAMPEAKRVHGWLEEHGWKVLTVEKGDVSDRTAQETGAIGMLVIAVDPSWDGEDGPVGSMHDYDKMADRISAGIHEAVRAAEIFLPSLEAGEGKRIAFLTSSCGSIRNCRDREQFVSHMILAGIHMQAKLMFNRLRRDGYTMRLFAADGGETDVQTICAGEYFTMNFCYDEKEPWIHSEENRLVMRNDRFEEIPW